MQKSIQEIASQYFKRFSDFSININDKNIFTKKQRTIIVIPCFKEAEILQTLQSISHCDTPKQETLVLILVNASETASKEIKSYNENTFEDIQIFIRNTAVQNITFKVFLNNELPQKYAGVGYARKILMDTALTIFSATNLDGIIVNTDADCLFTTNYIVEIEKAFENKKIKHGVVHFEHRIHEEKNPILAKAITEYELHLRYYKQALQWTRYPNVMHNIGSCMLCLASTYALEGGMNKRKAGEDFYFMNKLAKSHHFITVTKASVLPSCRTSDRVPFGTGKAMNDYLKDQTVTFQTYDFNCFEELKHFISLIGNLYYNDFSTLENTISATAFSFFISISIEKNLIKIRKQSKDKEAFVKRFFFWFDHLKALQFIHFLTENKYPKININKACTQFLNKNSFYSMSTSSLELLDLFRKKDLEWI